MAFSDPQSIVVGSDTFSMPRIFAKEGGTFSSSDGVARMDVRTVEGKNVLHQIKLTKNKITSDVFKPSENRAVSAYLTVNFSVPRIGFTITELVEMYSGLNTLLAANTNGNLKKLVGGES